MLGLTSPLSAADPCRKDEGLYCDMFFILTALTQGPRPGRREYRHRPRDLQPRGTEHLPSARRSVRTMACLFPKRQPAFRRVFDEVENSVEYLVTSGWAAHVDDRTVLQLL
jgi:hypothetical protein